MESSQESSILQARGLCSWFEGDFNFYMLLIGVSGLWMAMDTWTFLTFVVFFKLCLYDCTELVMILFSGE